LLCCGKVSQNFRFKNKIYKYKTNFSLSQLPKSVVARVRQSVIFSDNINQFKIKIMNANELRIGNYVLIDNPKSHPNLLNQPVQVVGIQSRIDISFPNSNTSISVEIDIHNGLSQFNEFINPISLTEEWLLKFGAKKFDLGFNLDANNFRFSFNSILLCWINGIKTEVKYVHQLQNLYFALTAHELNVA
jgi:hypothetical protein